MSLPYCEKRGRFWAVYDGAGCLVCVAVYRKGAREVVRRLMPPAPAEGLPVFSPYPNGRHQAAPTESTRLSERKQNYG